MSTTKTTKTADDRVEVNIPRGGDREDPNLFVAVNGVNYLLPRGKKSRVPKAVADEIARAERARRAGSGEHGDRGCARISPRLRTSCAGWSGWTGRCCRR